LTECTSPYSLNTQREWHTSKLFRNLPEKKKRGTRSKCTHVSSIQTNLNVRNIIPLQLNDFMSCQTISCFVGSL